MAQGATNHRGCHCFALTVIQAATLHWPEGAVLRGKAGRHSRGLGDGRFLRVVEKGKKSCQGSGKEKEDVGCGEVGEKGSAE